MLNSQLFAQRRKEIEVRECSVGRTKYTHVFFRQRPCPQDGLQ